MKLGAIMKGRAKANCTVGTVFKLPGEKKADLGNLFFKPFIDRVSIRNERRWHLIILFDFLITRPLRDGWMSV